ncbi:MAG: nucleotidyltransferase family protein [Firmicutes bacterium]|nr:nucleotidyltransferase family protein [Bacillota bacterium]
MVDALVLAGSFNNGPLKDVSPARFEALIPIGGKPMVEYVVEALRASGQIDRIVLVGPPDGLKPLGSGPKTTVAGSAGGIMENIEAGLVHLPGSRRVLLATSDIPLLTGEAVDDFIAGCGDMKGDLYYPIIGREVVEKRFPNTRRTYVTLKEGVFTGGNLFLINPAVFRQCMENGRRIIAQRKNPLGLCRLLGLSFVVKFLLRLVTIAEAQKKVSQLLGIDGRVVLSRFPEVGVDVDKPGDLELVKQAIEAKTGL